MVVCLTCLFTMHAQAAPPDLSGLGYEERLGGALPLKRVFQSSEGAEVALSDVLSRRPTLLILGYFSCPSLCGVIRDNALSAISRTSLVAGRDYNLVFLSIDHTETPVMAADAKASNLLQYPTPGAHRGWIFLTGAQPEISAVEAAVGFHARYSIELKQFLHPAGLVVLTPDGRVASYLLGVGFTPSNVKTAVVHASLGRVEPSDNPILLLCFHYDPAVGRYSLDIIKLLRLAGVITMCGIMGIVYLLLRRTRLS